MRDDMDAGRLNHSFKSEPSESARDMSCEPACGAWVRVGERAREGIDEWAHPPVEAVAQCGSHPPAFVSALTADCRKEGLRLKSPVASSMAPPPPTWMSGAERAAGTPAAFHALICAVDMPPVVGYMYTMALSPERPTALARASMAATWVTKSGLSCNGGHMTCEQRGATVVG